MTSRNFRLPPLEGDDVVVRMEREMLQRWGFLDAVKTQARPAGPDLDPNVALTPPHFADGNLGQTGSAKGDQVNGDDRDIVLEDRNEANVTNDLVPISIDARCSDSQKDNSGDISDTSSSPKTESHTDIGDISDTISSPKTENQTNTDDISDSNTSLKIKTHTDIKDIANSKSNTRTENRTDISDTGISDTSSISKTENHIGIGETGVSDTNASPKSDTSDISDSRSIATAGTENHINVGDTSDSNTTHTTGDISDSNTTHTTGDTSDSNTTHTTGDTSDSITTHTTGDTSDSNTTHTTGDTSDSNTTHTTGDTSDSNTTHTTGDISDSNTTHTTGDTSDSNTTHTTGDISDSNTTHTTGDTSDSNTTHTTGDTSDSNTTHTTGDIYDSNTTHTTGDISDSNTIHTTGDISDSNATHTTGDTSDSNATHTTGDTSDSNATHTTGDTSDSNTTHTSSDISDSGTTSLQAENDNVTGNTSGASLGLQTHVDSDSHQGRPEDIGANISPREDVDSSDKRDITSRKTMSEQARKLYDQADTAYSKNEFCECLVFVDEALELDDASDDHDVELWLLRAKVMNSMEDHREALRSVFKVKAVERSSRLWVEGALALEKLGLLATAENWFARALQVCNATDARLKNRHDVMDILHMMRSRLRIERVFGPLIKGKPIRVSASFKFNRAVNATRKISKSEVIVQELPEMLEQSIKSHRFTACAQCAKSLIQPSDLLPKEKGSNPDLKKAVKKLWPKIAVVGCMSCKEVKYCSYDCRDANWESGHRVVCPSNPESTASMLYDVRKSFRDVIAADGSSWQGWWNAEFSPIFLARVWASVMCRAQRLADLNDKESYLTADWLMVESCLEKYSSSTKFQAESESIPKMHELIGSIFKRSKIMRFPIEEEEFNKRYAQLASNTVSFHDPVSPAAKFFEVVNKDKKLAKKLQSHVDITRVPVVEFHGLFPLVCCLNHSCFPNAEVTSERVEGKPGLSVRALMDIKNGEEVVVSYVNPRLERHERRSQLWKKYKFICQCLKCIHEGRGPDVCTNCGISTESESESAPRDNVSVSNSKKAKVGGLANANDSSNGNGIPNKNTKTTNVKEGKDGQWEDSSNNEKDPVHLELCGASSADSADTSEGKIIVSDSDSLRIDVASSSSEEKVAMEETSTSTLTSVPTAKENEEEAEEEENQQLTEDGQHSKPKLKFSVCGRCRRAWYCSAQCQKEAWLSGHKKICVAR